MWTVASRAGARLGSVTGLLALILGGPVGQVLLVGWPLPHQAPSPGEIGNALTRRDWLTDTNLLNTLSVLLWLLWVMFAASVVVELVAAIRGVTAPRYRLLAPTQGLAAILVAGLTTAILTSSPALTATTPLAAPVAQVAAPATTPGNTGSVRMMLAADSASTADCTPDATATADPPAGSTVVGPVYEVVRGDWLWHIAARYLGDPLRYVEIANLNPNLELRDHRFPDHIEATWRIQLPADAHDRGSRVHATGTLVARSSPTQTPSGPGASSGATPAPSTGSTNTPGPSTPGTSQSTPMPAQPTPTVAAGTVTTPSATVLPGPAAQTTTRQDPDGVTEPTPTTTVAAPTVVSTVTAAMPGPVASGSAGQDPDGVIEPLPNPSGAAAPSPSGGASPTTTSTAESSGSQDPSPSASAEGQDGVSLPNRSGWVPWALAGALAAAAAMVWLQRRRTYRPRPLDGTDADDRPEPEDLPPTVQAVQRAWRQRADDTPAPPPEPTPRAKRPAPAPPPPVAVPPTPAMPPLPRGGLGLTGPAAADAARGAMVAALAAGAPTDPDAQSTVVIPADVMITLLGADAVTIGTWWPRLRITPDLDTALKILEARLLGAARLLDEHDATDLAALRSPESTAPPLPPMLLVTAAPPPQQQERLRVVLGLGQALDVTAVLLGDWQHGQTVAVDPDGTCHPTRAGGGETPARMTVLDTTAAEEMLRTVREAHTGELAQPIPTEAIRARNEKRVPAAAETTATATDTADGQAHVPAQPEPPDERRLSAKDNDHQATEPRARVRVRVLGPPTIANRPETVRLRAYAVELLVYLAVRTDGATADEIMEAMWPDTRRAPAAQRLHQAISNLRQNLAGALPGGGDIARPDPVIRVNGRWRLNPDVVEVDLWQLRAAHTAAKATSGQERFDALARAAAAYGGTLAGDHDYPWADRHRQGVLNLAIDAHTALATALADTDPDQALRLLQTAAELDPLNEDVARELMRAQHRAGDLDAVRATLRRLTLALDEIGAEPGALTTELADELRRDLNRRVW